MSERALENMELNELKRLQRDVEKAIQNFEKRKLEEARLALEEHARALGVTLESVTGGAGRKMRSKSTSPAKYQNPDDHSQTWTGRGRKPRWFLEAMAKGKNPEDFEIS